MTAKTRWRTVIACALCAVGVPLLTGGAQAANGGNSDNAKACQNGGWQQLVRADGSEFKNQGACVSYAAQGGTLKPKQTPQQQWTATCLAGTGSPDFSSPNVWDCGGLTVQSSPGTVEALNAICTAAGGTPGGIRPGQGGGSNCTFA
jgi:hypothetical protein